jgi:hypothetical protein
VIITVLTKGLHSSNPETQYETEKFIDYIPANSKI